MGVILCEYRNKRRWTNVACYNRAERFLMDVGERSGRVIAICKPHYDGMTSESLRPWKEVTREEWEVFRVHSS